MIRKVQFSETAWQQFNQWTRNTVATRRIFKLLNDIDLAPADKGIGAPLALRGFLAGWTSRRIDTEHRLVYRIQDDVIQVIWCSG